MTQINILLSKLKEKNPRYSLICSWKSIKNYIKVIFADQNETARTVTFNTLKLDRRNSWTWDEISPINNALSIRSELIFLQPNRMNKVRRSIGPSKL